MGSGLEVQKKHSAVQDDCSREFQNRQGRSLPWRSSLTVHNWELAHGSSESPWLAGTSILTALAPQELNYTAVLVLVQPVPSLQCPYSPPLPLRTSSPRTCHERSTCSCWPRKIQTNVLSCWFWLKDQWKTLPGIQRLCYNLYFPMAGFDYWARNALLIKQEKVK